MTEGRIHAELDPDGGLSITLERPGKGNALSAVMTDRLQGLFATPPEGARFIVLQGAGPDFCAGRDSPMPAKGTRVTAADIRARVADPVLTFYQSVRNTPLPVIVLVRGRAHGVGFALAGLGDIVIADDTADFAVPEMNRDIPPLLVASALADRLPRAALARAILGRESFDAAGALHLGLVTECVAAGDAAARVADWRHLLTQNSVTTLSSVKRFLNVAPDMGFAMLREYAAAAISGAVAERFIGQHTAEKP